jgi:dTDP-4-dehydrorhamnose 3,5-epimerase
MQFSELPIKGAFLIQVQSYKDHRGSFARAYCKKEFASAGIDLEIVQSNLSFSEKENTLRGMHYQKGDHAEKKLVKCIKGRILDVLLDLRKDSSGFGQYYMQELSGDNNLMILVPEGVAHGFLTLDPDCFVFYQVSNYYNKENEAAVRWDDPRFSIPWPVSDPIVSERDANHPDYVS